MQCILISFAIISLKMKELVECLLAVMWLLLVISVYFMVLWDARQCMVVVKLTYFMNVWGDTELTKVASGMRCDVYSVMPDHKEASTRVKKHPKTTSDVEYEQFCICCKNTDVHVLK